MVTMSRSRWVLLAYHLPREPSTPRIALWRKLRRLGTVQLQDGLVALPLDARTREQLEWLAEEVTDAGGQADIWLAEPATAALERVLTKRMAAAVATDYQAVTQAAQAARSLPPGPRRRTVGRLRRELRRIALRDHFPPPERDQARTAVTELAATLTPPTPEAEVGVGR
jgi:hypothetical protein